MSADLAGGCLELVARVLLETVVNGLGEPLCRWCVVVGEFSVWLITFGRVRLERSHEILSGIIGFIVHAVLIGLLIWWIMATPEGGK